MSGTSWDAVSRSQLWNTKRPVWLQAIIHLVEPHVIPAVVELLDLLDSVSFSFKIYKTKVFENDQNTCSIQGKNLNDGFHIGFYIFA